MGRKVKREKIENNDTRTTLAGTVEANEEDGRASSTLLRGDRVAASAQS